MVDGRLGHRRCGSPEVLQSGRRAGLSNSVIYLSNGKCLLLEFEGADGTLVSTRMSFAVVDDTVFVPTRAESPNVSRICCRPLVRVAACTMLGVPFGDYIECTARVASQGRQAEAEAALRRIGGVICRLLGLLTRGDYVYLELTPVARPEAEVVPLRVAPMPADKHEKPPGIA
jgi:hypothetical protein